MRFESQTDPKRRRKKEKDMFSQGRLEGLKCNLQFQNIM
jgi:hypothetical protein